MSDTTTKPNKQYTKEVIKLFWQHAWRHKAHVIGLGILIPVAILVFQFLPPLVISHILERLSDGDFTKDDLWGSFGNDLLLYAGLVFIGGVILWRTAIIVLWRLEGLVLRDIHQRLFAHLMSMDANFHANRFGGSLVSQTNKFAGSYVRFADTTLFQVVSLILSFIFTMIILAPRAPWIAVFLLGFSIIFMITAVLITKKVRKLNAVEASAQTRQTGYLADAVTNVMAIKSFASSVFERTRFAKATEKTRAATLDVMRASTKRDAYFASVTGILSIVSLTMAIASVVLFDGDIGTVFLVISYTGRISVQLWDFSQSTLRNYNRALGDSQEMTEILGLKPTVQDPEQPEPSHIAKGAITFRDMSFNHDESNDDEGLFENLNLSIRAGEKIGLVGHSGSGKTTLTRLLLRFADVDSGEILIDGQNIAKITQEDLRRSIAYVPQEPLLFHRSIKENIAYGKPDATDEEIRIAAEKAYATEFIDKLPLGYDTLVGERGVKLSGGQRQRIAIARAILKDAPILVLDEATSALDSESELLIQKALRELMKRRTAIVIAHRLSTIQKMDRIIVLEDGTITEQGSHSELTAQDGIYAKLWAHQSGGFIED